MIMKTSDVIVNINPLGDRPNYVNLETMTYRTTEIKPRIIKNKRINATKRIAFTKSVKEQVFLRSQHKCELECQNKAEAIHHKLAVRTNPEIQLEVDNLVHLCLKHHREQHLYLPEQLFKGVNYGA